MDTMYLYTHTHIHACTGSETHFKVVVVSDIFDGMAIIKVTFCVEHSQMYSVKASV